MTEYPLGTLILGIIGTITGTIALFISFWTYRKEAPHLKVSVTKCEHKLIPSSMSNSNVKTLNFWTTFQVKNLGDRGTRITDVGLTFTNAKQTLHF